ncbi:hypothetical protein, partial [Treponema sp. R80B11-R83G3]
IDIHNKNNKKNQIKLRLRIPIKLDPTKKKKFSNIKRCNFFEKGKYINLNSTTDVCLYNNTKKKVGIEIEKILVSKSKYIESESIIIFDFTLGNEYYYNKEYVKNININKGKCNKGVISYNNVGPEEQILSFTCSAANREYPSWHFFVKDFSDELSCEEITLLIKIIRNTEPDVECPNKLKNL